VAALRTQGLCRSRSFVISAKDRELESMATEIRLRAEKRDALDKWDGKCVPS
jgi:hypothetical protein